MTYERFLVEALRCGIRVTEFWELTPRETFMEIEAAIWRNERQAQNDVALAWHIAALSRTQRMPSLKHLLQPPKAKALEGNELERRREEHAALVAGLPKKMRKTNGT